MTASKPRTSRDILVELGDLGHTDPEKLDTLLSRVNTSSEARLSLARALLEPMRGRELPVPEGAQCTECKSSNLKRIGAPAWGPWGGSIECLDCGRKASFMEHLGKSCITVEPLESSA